MKKDSRLEIRLTSDQKEMVVAIAKERKTTITKVIEELIKKLAKG
jgi:uncharacterized protein (DUF1778 family)